MGPNKNEIKKKFRKKGHMKLKSRPKCTHNEETEQNWKQEATGLIISKWNSFYSG